MARHGVLLVAAVALLLSVHAAGQGRGGAQNAPPATARAAAAFDITGYWVSEVTEKWRFRMLVPDKGDYQMVPLNPEGRKIAAAWDPAKDQASGEGCRSYGAVGLLQVPGRLHITWQDDNTLRIEADYGSQTRTLHFGPPPDTGRLDYGNATFVPPRAANVEPPPGIEPSWQGYSIAAWTIMGGSGTFARGGSLKVVTSRLKPGYYWKNGMPYTGNATLTEHFRVMELPDKSQWIRFTQIVDDPDYLTQPWIVNYQFRKLPDGSKWNPTPCSVK